MKNQFYVLRELDWQNGNVSVRSSRYRPKSLGKLSRAAQLVGFLCDGRSECPLAAACCLGETCWRRIKAVCYTKVLFEHGGLFADDIRENWSLLQFFHRNHWNETTPWQSSLSSFEVLDRYHHSFGLRRHSYGISCNIHPLGYDIFYFWC